MLLYYDGSFHPRISNYHAKVFTDSKTWLNKFAGGKYAKGHETQKRNLQLKKPLSHR